jgi:Arc/MetJ-type ribon-helix-helix transcriptional regulator
MVKLVISLDKRTVGNLDRWVKEGKYRNRSRAFQAAVDLLIEREKRTRLARELSKLDPRKEQRMAEEGLGGALLRKNPMKRYGRR